MPRKKRRASRSRSRSKSKSMRSLAKSVAKLTRSLSRKSKRSTSRKRRSRISKSRIVVKIAAAPRRSHLARKRRFGRRGHRWNVFRKRGMKALMAYVRGFRRRRCSLKMKRCSYRHLRRSSRRRHRRRGYRRTRRSYRRRHKRNYGGFGASITDLARSVGGTVKGFGPPITGDITRWPATIDYLTAGNNRGSKPAGLKAFADYVTRWIEDAAQLWSKTGVNAKDLTLSILSVISTEIKAQPPPINNDNSLLRGLIAYVARGELVRALGIPAISVPFTGGAAASAERFAAISSLSLPTSTVSVAPSQAAQSLYA